MDIAPLIWRQHGAQNRWKYGSFTTGIHDRSRTLREVPALSLLLLLADDSREVRTEAGREIFRKAWELIDAEKPRECFMTDYYARLLAGTEGLPAGVPQTIMEYLLQEIREHEFTDYVRDASGVLSAIWPHSAPACDVLLNQLKNGSAPDSTQIGFVISAWGLHSPDLFLELLPLLGPEAMDGVHHESDSLLLRHPGLLNAINGARARHGYNPLWTLEELEEIRHSRREREQS